MEVNKTNIYKYIIILIFNIVFIIGIIFIIYLNNKQINTDKIILQDTTYNHTILDTINKLIYTKEKVIINLTYKKDEDIKQALIADSITAINQFKELVME